jgi:hypothetical protein
MSNKGWDDHLARVVGHQIRLDFFDPHKGSHRHKRMPREGTKHEPMTKEWPKPKEIEFAFKKPIMLTTGEDICYLQREGISLRVFGRLHREVAYVKITKNSGPIDITL